MTPGVHIYGISHLGLQRKSNEDSFVIWQDQKDNTPSLIVLCDGIGGHFCGDLASLSCCRSFLSEWRKMDNGEKITSHYEAEKFLSETAQKSNLNIYSRNLREKFPRPMGCTLTAGILLSGAFYFVNIGDSRIYFYSSTQKQLRQLSVDDVLENSNPGNLSHSHCITGAIGISPLAELHCGKLRIQAGDRILFCSDGLFDEVPDTRIASLLGAASSADEAASALVREALIAGGNDNITAICVFC